MSKEIHQKSIENHCAYWFNIFMRDKNIYVDSIVVQGPDDDGDYLIEFNSLSEGKVFKHLYYMFHIDLEKYDY